MFKKNGKEKKKSPVIPQFFKNPLNTMPVTSSSLKYPGSLPHENIHELLGSVLGLEKTAHTSLLHPKYKDTNTARNREKALKERGKCM